MVQNKIISVEFVYITPASQNILSLELPEGSTVKQAITRSGLLKSHPEIDLGKNKIGIFNRLEKLDTILKNGDRLEIYRPLLVDPKEARRRRANR